MRHYLLLFAIVFFASLRLHSQPKDVLKFDCIAKVQEKFSTKEKQTSEGYSLLIIDFFKNKIETYPDSIVLNFIGSIEKKITTEFLILTFECRDKNNNSCKAHLMYALKTDKAVAMKLEWDNWYVLYFIEKQTQFPNKQ